MVFGIFKRAVSVFTGHGSSSVPPEPESANSRLQAKRAGRHAHFVDDDGVLPASTRSRKRAASEAPSRLASAAKRARLDAKAPTTPRIAKKASRTPKKSSALLLPLSLPTPPATRSRSTRATRRLRSRSPSPILTPPSSLSPSPPALRSDSPVKNGRRQPLFVNDDDSAPNHLPSTTGLPSVREALRAENLERTLFLAKPRLIQEGFSGNPWLVILSSSMLDTFSAQQNSKAVTAVFCALSARWPTPESILSAPIDDLKAALDSLSNYLPQLQALAAAYLRYPIPWNDSARPSLASAYYTPYVCDAYRMFCVPGEWRNVLPDPHSDLARYLQWRWARQGEMWFATYGPVGPIKTSQVREVIVQCWAPSLHALPGTMAPSKSTSKPAGTAAPTT